jgi:GntR family transcriptional repressor for pyruvate dehydrogenase complex
MRQGKLSDSVAHRIETLIVEGVWKTGDRLPSERELAQQLEVSRPSLREALHKLEVRGLVETLQGGGTFVRPVLDENFGDPLHVLLKSHPETMMDFIEFRKTMEGISAYYAALRCTDADREIIRRRFEAMEVAHHENNPSLEAHLDAEFHLSVAEAAHNVVLAHVMGALFDILKDGVFQNRNRLYSRKGSRDLLLRQHRNLFEAVIEGDPEAARAAAHAHLNYVQEAIRELELTEYRNEISLHRLQRMNTTDKK